MGGYGSGSYQAEYAMQTVEDVSAYRPALTISMFVKDGFTWDRNGSGSMKWGTGALVFRIYNNLITLFYPLPGGQSHRLYVSIVRTYPYYGGMRYWFQCPACKRRCKKLYRPANTIDYHCRVCHKLTYASKTEYPLMSDAIAEMERFDRRQQRIAKKYGLTWPITSK